MKSLKILRRLFLIVSAAFSFAIFVACANGTSKNNSEITGVYAPDIYAVYDGTPHYITIYGTKSGDEILYSENGIDYMPISPSFILPGSYTVYCKINRTGYTELTVSTKIIIDYAVLDGISAPDITVFYDGTPHSITLQGTKDSDAVTYSTDGENFSQVPPSFTEIGRYTVYYSVVRGYEVFRSSCTVTILPDVRGRYFNRSQGLVAVRDDGAYVNNILKDCEIFTDGSGFIDGLPFSVSSETLTYGGTEFTKIPDGEYVYELCAERPFVYYYAATLPVFYCAENGGKLTITSEAENCTVSLGGDTLLSVQNVNYCENAEIISYAPLIFEQTFESSDEITIVELTLTRRAINPFVPQTLYAVYDGKPHTFDFPERFIFLDGEIHEYVEAGTYTATAVFLSDEYLPLVADCTLKIIRNLDGLYFSPERVIKIDDNNVYFDGECVGSLTASDSGALMFDGIAVTPTDDGIVYDGIKYTAINSDVFIFRVNGKAVGRAVLADSAANITVVWDGETATLLDDNGVLFAVTLTGSIELSYLGRTLSPSSVGEQTTYILGLAEIKSDVIILDCTTK